MVILNPAQQDNFMNYHNRLVSFDSAAPMSTIALDAAGQASGNAFLVGELEKRNLQINEPLTSVTWPRDIVMSPGGGWVQWTSNIFADYGTIGNYTNSITAGETTAIPVIQMNLSKDNKKVFPFSNILRVPLVDQAYLANIGRSLDNILETGLRLNHQKIIDINVYTGFPKYGTYGLVNSSSVISHALAANNAAANSRLWANKTPQEILYDINYSLAYTWAQSQYDITGMANHILLPPLKYTALLAPMSTTSNISILRYILENNIAVNQGVDLTIVPCRQCIAAGITSDLDRMVTYCNNVNRVTWDETVPLSRRLTQPSVEHAGYLSLYQAQIGETKFLYDQCAYYTDGI